MRKEVGRMNLEEVGRLKWERSGKMDVVGVMSLDLEGRGIGKDIFGRD
jgi:hypothetical protein